MDNAERASAPRRLAANLAQGNEIVDGSIGDKLNIEAQRFLESVGLDFFSEV